MKCPFELPIEKKVRKYEKGELDALVLVQANGELIHTAGRDKNDLSDKLDYIVQAVNSHEKFKDTLGKIKDQAERATCVQDRSVGIIKGVCKVIADECTEALEEAEKE